MRSTWSRLRWSIIGSPGSEPPPWLLPVVTGGLLAELAVYALLAYDILKEAS